MTTIEIVLLVLAFVIIIGLVIVIIMLNNNAKKPIDTGTAGEFGKLNANLDNLKSEFKQDVDISIQKQITAISDRQREQNENDIKRLTEFEKNIQTQLDDSFKAINEKVNKGLLDGFEKNSESIKNVTESLAKLEEAKKNLDALQSQVTNLNSVLSNNTTSGRFGELSLETLLHDVFGDTEGCYAYQYPLKDKEQEINTRPDAVVFMPDPIKILCIDCKFNFNLYKNLFDDSKDENEEQLKRDFRDALKGEINKIAKDYIVKGKTAEYAILYIPSDGIYSYIQGDVDLYASIVTYARNKNVVLSSPSTLQPILANLNVLKFNISTRKNIDSIIYQLGLLRKEYKNFSDSWNSFNGEVAKLSEKSQTFSKSVEKVGLRLDKINSIAPSGDDDKKEEESLEKRE